MKERWALMIVIYVVVTASMCHRGSLSTSDTEDQWRVERIEMVRSPCKGECPVDVLVCHGKGEAHYEGQKHVDRLGDFNRSLNQQELDKLKSAWMASRFHTLDSDLTSGARDLPITYITVVEDGVTQQVKFDRLPEDLKPLVSTLKEIALSGAWQPVN